MLFIEKGFCWIKCLFSFSLPPPHQSTHPSILSTPFSYFFFISFASVTRCWNKKQPIFFKRCPKNRRNCFDIKSYIFKKMPPKVPNFRAAFVIEIVAKIFQKAPNLVTLCQSWVNKARWDGTRVITSHALNSWDVCRRSQNLKCTFNQF